MYNSKSSELKITLLLVNIIVNAEYQHRQHNAVGLYRGISKKKSRLQLSKCTTI